MWNGGRVEKADGYILVKKPDHPNAEKSGYIPEHIMVMSDHLSRPIVNGETVHHKNGIRNDNRIENLELWASRHPKGQRISDQVAWAIELLKEYAPETLSTRTLNTNKPILL